MRTTHASTTYCDELTSIRFKTINSSNEKVRHQRIA